MDCKTKHIDPEKKDRSCGFLKEAERKFLLGEPDISSAYKSTLRNQIRTRTKHAFADFYLLTEFLDEEQKEDLLNLDMYVTYDLPKNEETVEKMAYGPVLFVAQALMGDEWAENLFDAMMGTELVSDGNLGELLQSDTAEDKSEKLIPMFAQLLHQSGYTRPQAQRELNQAWPR